MSAITEPLRQILLACEADPSKWALLRDHAEAAAAAGRDAEACTALLWCGMTLSTIGRFPQALAAVAQAVTLGRRCEAAVALEAPFFEALIQKESGDHDGSAQTLIRFLSGPHFEQVPLVRRLDTLAQLAYLCTAAHDGDAALACWSLAEAQCARAGTPMPGLFRTHRACTAIDLCLYGHAPFEAVLRPRDEPALPAHQRSRLLAEAAADCEAAVLEPDRSMRGTVVPLAQVARWVLIALRDDSAEAAQQAYTAYEAADLRNPDLELECRVRVVAALLYTHQTEPARRLVEQAPPDDPRHRDVCDSYRWQFLVALTHQRCGRFETALQHYQRYAAELSAVMPRMNARVRQLLGCVTALPGARPADQPGRVPSYMEAAKRRLAEDKAPLKVSALAQAMGVSERTLREAFHVYEGMSPKDYQTRVRLQSVKDFLDAGLARDASVSEIAERFGFSNAGRFARQFRSQFGMPVAEAKRQTPAP